MSQGPQPTPANLWPFQGPNRFARQGGPWQHSKRLLIDAVHLQATPATLVGSVLHHKDCALQGKTRQPGLADTFVEGVHHEECCQANLRSNSNEIGGRRAKSYQHANVQNQPSTLFVEKQSRRRNRKLCGICSSSAVLGL